MPFLALRSYLPDDHPSKADEIGSEATPAEFLDVMLELTAQWRRVLAPHGSLVVELGDTFSGSSMAGSGDRAVEAEGGPTRQRRGPAPATEPNRRGPAWPMSKSLSLIPELYRLGLAYGVNPLTGSPSPAGRWRVRNVVRWVRPNPAVGNVGDRFRVATSDIVVACSSESRWFDGHAVRRPPRSERADNPAAGVPLLDWWDELEFLLRAAPEDLDSNGKAKWVRTELVDTYGLSDTWEIPPGGFRGAHYATFPDKLVVPLIESMCPREVCTACGTPRRRIVDATYTAHGDAERQNAEPRALRGAAETGVNGSAQQFAHGRATKHVETVGWTACDCAAPFRPGIVLDPFVGSGTTLSVASGHGRTGIGIDLDERNLDLARERVGMFLTTEHPWATVEDGS